jgi:hypothetical protein
MNNADYTGKAPFYQKWDEKAFQFDTMHLHWQARLLYRALLQSAWHLSTRPDLPADDNQLQNILSVPSDIWTQHSKAVRSMFHIDNEIGVLWQKRLRADWKTLTDYRAKQKELANRRYNKTNAGDAQNLEEKSREEYSSSYQLAAAKAPAKASLSRLSSDESPSSDHFGLSLPYSSGSQPDPASTSVCPETSDEAGKKPDVDYLVSVCHELEWQLPKRSDVQSLLNEHTVSEIAAAMREYAEGCHGDDHAERLFFAEGGGTGVVLARRRRPAGVKS